MSSLLGDLAIVTYDPAVISVTLTISKVLLTILFYEIIKRVFKTVAAKKRVDTVATVVGDTGEFRIGPIFDRFIVVEGNGLESFASVTTKASSVPAVLPLAAREELDRITTELSRKNDGHFKLYNGDLYSFVDFQVTRTNDEEKVCVNLEFGHSKYFEFLALDKLARDPDFRARYLDEAIRVRKPKFCLGFGVALTLITSDDKLVVPRRSDHVSVWKNMYTISANEALSPSLDGGAAAGPDVYVAASRAAKEELGIDIPVESIRFYALGFETVSLQWALLATAKTGLHSSDVDESFRILAKDKFENAEIAFIDFTPEAVIRFIKEKGEDMVPGSKTQFVLSLLAHGVNVSDIRDVLSKIN
jgi:hypothetical protein